MTEKQRVNIDIDKYLWKQVGIKAAEWEVQKREIVEKALGKFIEDNKQEKGITFTRFKKHEHIVGDEYTEEAVVKDGADLRMYYGILFGEMPSEVHDEQKEAIEAILNLENGDYSLDHGDFWLNVEIEDA